MSTLKPRYLAGQVAQIRQRLSPPRDGGVGAAPNHVHCGATVGGLAAYDGHRDRSANIETHLMVLGDPSCLYR